VAIPLIIDSASAARRLTGEALRAWAEDRTVFISSEMQDLGDIRRRLADALRDLGLRVVMFEDLGGRDEDAQTAYLSGVEQSDIYLGIVADRYGRMLDSGRSPTHEEYRRARERGKRISFWVASDDAERQGNARDFIQEVQTFHTTGPFTDGDDLVRRVEERVTEIAADDEAPWIKVSDAVFRASVIRDAGDHLVVEAEIRNREVVRHLEGLRPDQWNRAGEVAITTPDRSGQGVVTALSTEARSQSVRRVELEANITWADGTQPSGAFSTGGLSHDDLVERGAAAALVGAELPEDLARYGFVRESEDPIGKLVGHTLPEGTYQAIARLLVTEYLVGGQRASAVDQFFLGPPNGGQRQLEVTYTETRQAANFTPGRRTVRGARNE
jgi:hypothetical protein